MKKFLLLLVVLATAVFLVSCGSTYEIAMITDTGDIDDGSFNQGTWEGIKKYAEENKKSHKYYKPAGEATADYLAAIDLAVSGGAKIVITPGFYFETPIYEAQTKYPDVKFVLIDGSPHNGDYNVEIKDNTLSVFFAEHEAAFFAGYGSIYEGFESVGYMGGIAVPAVQRFGIGYVAGAYYAAKQKNNMTFKFNPTYYHYLGTFGPSDEYKTLAANWFDAGVNVIHAAAGGAGSSVMAAAAERTNKWVVGVDSDQAGASNTVISSALKGVGEAAYSALDDFYNDKFVGGRAITLTAKEDAVGLPLGDSFRFKTFTVAQYEAILKNVQDGTVVVPDTAEKLVTFIRNLGFTLSEVDATALTNKVNGTN